MKNRVTKGMDRLNLIGGPVVYPCTGRAKTSSLASVCHLCIDYFRIHSQSFADGRYFIDRIFSGRFSWRAYAGSSSQWFQQYNRLADCVRIFVCPGFHQNRTRQADRLYDYAGYR